MLSTTIRKVVDYHTRGSEVHLNCAAITDKADRPMRIIPVVIEFLRPDVFRFSLDVNPEAGAVASPVAEDSTAARSEVRLRTTATDKVITVDTGLMTLEIGRAEWRFDVFDRKGKRLLGERTEKIGPRDTPHVNRLGFSQEEVNGGSLAVTNVHTAFSLSFDEHFYGLGEKFTSLDKRGQKIDAWTVKTHGTESERSYKNVPFYMSSRGYGLLVDSGRQVRFDLGQRTTAAMTIEVAGDRLEFVVFHASTYREILGLYTLYTGRSRLPPKWSFGLWMSRAVYASRGEVESVASRIREERIPCDVLHIDPAWMRDGHHTDLIWDEDRFPEPKEMIDHLHQSGFRVSLWEHPYLAAESEAFAEAASRGYLVKNGDGRAYILDGLVIDQTRGGIIDFTNPEAILWWKQKHRDLLAMGVDVFKTDFGEDVPADAVFANGQSGAVMHNLYPNLYNQAVDEITVDVRGEDDSVTWGRSAWAGGQRYPVYWGGDPPTTFEGMASALRGGLSLSMSGFPFWSHDIGGFWGEPGRELFIRWAQFGLLSSHARCHGTTPREPWHFGGDVLRIFRTYAELRYRLLPYIFTCAFASTTSGIPLVRPTILEYPSDPGADGIDTQFFLGSALLVAPVFDAAGRADVYLPEGEWIDFWTGDRMIGPRWVLREVSLDIMPIYLRAGSVIPMGQTTGTVTTGLPSELDLQIVFASEAEVTAVGELYDDAAGALLPIEAAYRLSEGELSVRIEAHSRFSVIRMHVHGVQGAPGRVLLNGALLEMRQDSDQRGTWRLRSRDGAVEVHP